MDELKDVLIIIFIILLIFSLPLIIDLMTELYKIMDYLFYY